MQIDIPELSEEEYLLFKDLIYKETGIFLDSGKKYLVRLRLHKRVSACGFESYRQYYDFLLSFQGRSELSELFDAISTNLTSFFREKEHFDFLNTVIIPHIVTNNSDKKLRGWCAASSTGEEPYSLMMSLMEHIPNFAQWDVKLLATDISSKVLHAAVQGQYSFKKTSGLPAEYLQKYFQLKGEGADRFYQVNRELIERIVFARFNLMRSVYPFRSKFDFIFCRNVLIYFDSETQANVVSKMADFLTSGGYLIVGHSETLIGFEDPRMVKINRTTFQRL